MAFVLGILLGDVMHDGSLDLRMAAIPWNGAHHLHSTVLLRLEVLCLKGAGEGARAQFLYDLIYCEGRSTQCTLATNNVTLSAQKVANRIVLFAVIVVRVVRILVAVRCGSVSAAVGSVATHEPKGKP